MYDLFEYLYINDFVYVFVIKNGVFGFNIFVGGFFSLKWCVEVILMDVWVLIDDVVLLCKVILEIY